MIAQWQTATNDSQQIPQTGGGPMLDTNGLWLEIVYYYPADTNLWLLLHGTSDTNLYQLRSATSLTSTNWDLGELLWGDWESDETLLTPVLKTNAVMFYRAQHANNVMQIWNMQDSEELNPTNTSDPGHSGMVGIQNGVAKPATNDINVYYTIGGTARNGIDYSNLPGVLTLAAGMQRTNILIQPTAAGLKPDQTIVLTLLPNSNYLIDPLYIVTTNTLYANPELVPTAYGDEEPACPNTLIYFQLNGYDLLRRTLAYSIATWPAHGILDTSSIPQVIYTPTNCFEGLDSFTFTVYNGVSNSDPATVIMQVSDLVSASPVTAPASSTRPSEFHLWGADRCQAGVQYILPTSLPHGSLNTNGSYYATYTPTDTNFTGVENFNYIVSSLCGEDTATSSVTLYVPSGPILGLGCNPFWTGAYVSLEWALGANESQMEQQLGCISDYKIYRSAVSGGPYICIHTNTEVNQTTYIDAGVAVGQTNYYVVTFDFTWEYVTYETPFSNEIRVVVPKTYDLIAADATWDVWNVSTNQPRAWLGNYQAPFSCLYPGQYYGNVTLPLPNSYWPTATNGVDSMWSNNIALVIPSDWTNQTQLAQVRYSIAIDNDYWLYLNNATNYIDSTNREGYALWSPFQSFENVAPGLLHGGTNFLRVVIRDRGDIDYFSMVVTTNNCGQ